MPEGRKRMVAIGVGIWIKTISISKKSTHAWQDSKLFVFCNINSDESHTFGLYYKHRVMGARMRAILLLLLFVVCIILMVGIYIQQPQLFGDGAANANATTVLATITRAANNPVIDLQSYKSTQTAIVAQAQTTAQSPTMVVQTATINPNQPTVKPTIAKPVRLPDTGSVDSSDIWTNIPILLLIGICVVVSLGLFWQSRRTIK